MKKGQQGFTLLEVLMVTILLFFLSYAVYSSVRSATKTKLIVEAKSEILQEFRSALSILERDLRSAFYVTAEDYGWYPRAEKQKNDPGSPPRPVTESAPLPTKPTPITLFQGKENMLFFSSRTHQRLSANSPENEEHFVFYELRGNELHRSESKRAIRVEDRQDPQDYRSFILIDKVQSVRFAFWSDKQERWIPEWDSEKSETLNRVPEAVRIEIKFTPEYESENESQAKELLLLTAIRLNEAAYRNITWSNGVSPTKESPSK